MNINATILGQAFAFVLFVLFCMKYVWPPIMAAIEKRQKEITDGLASAERAKKEPGLSASQCDRPTEKKRKLMRKLSLSRLINKKPKLLMMLKQKQSWSVTKS